MKENKEQAPDQPNKEVSGTDQKDRGQNSATGNESTPIYLTTDSTLQTPEEHERDQRIDPRKDDTMDVSDTDLEEIKAGRLTGREPGAANNEE